MPPLKKRNPTSYTITEEGLVIPLEMLEGIGLEGDLDVLVRGHMLIIKPKSLSNKVRGIIKDTELSESELDELYFEYKKGS